MTILDMLVSMHKNNSLIIKSFEIIKGDYTGLVITGMAAFSIIALGMQFTKEGQVKKLIDGYLSLIKTDWYSKQLNKQYVFFCNLIG